MVVYAILTILFAEMLFFTMLNDNDHHNVTDDWKRFIGRLFVISLFTGLPAIAQEVPTAPTAEDGAGTLALSESDTLTAEEDTEASPPEADALPPDPEIDPEILRQANIDREIQERRIAELEENNSRNFYNAELTDAYLSLGNTLGTLGQYDEAATTYERALQTVRATNGLNSLAQIPVLEAILKSQFNQKNWQAVDSTAHLIFHVNRRNYPVGSEERIQAIRNLGDWKDIAAGKQLIKANRRESLDMESLFADEIRLLEETADYPGKNTHMVSLNVGEARTKLEIAKNVLEQPISDFRSAGNPTTMAQRCYILRMPNGSVRQVCETVEVPNIDFYVDPANMKNMEIGRRLQDVRRNIAESYELVQEEGIDLEARDAMLQDIHDLANTYNAFMTEHRQ